VDRAREARTAHLLESDQATHQEETIGSKIGGAWNKANVHAGEEA